MRTRIKICGMTRADEAVMVARHGADAIGLVFHEPSPRAVTPAVAADIVAALPPFCVPVALFVDPPAARVREVLERTRIAVLQFHGDEPPAFCAQFGLPYLKAIRMREGTDLAEAANRHADAAALLLDAWHPARAGGTGTTFRWERPPRLRQPVIVAGGLHSANVTEAIRVMRPYGVDVSSGVEATPGRKCAGRVAAFARAVTRTDLDDGRSLGTARPEPRKP